jgi:hypothetical protein
MQQWPNLVRLLSGIPWAVVGAVASRRYMPERATRDLDIVVLPRDADKVGGRLREAGYRQETALAIGGVAWRAPDGTPVDVIEGQEEWWPEALRLAATNLDSDGTPVLTAPYLVLMKLLAGRVQDVADVSRILGSMQPQDLESVRALIRGRAADLSEDLESLITLGRLEQET